MAPFPERIVGKELRAGGLLVRFLEEDTCIKPQRELFAFNSTIIVEVKTVLFTSLHFITPSYFFDNEAFTKNMII